MRVLWISSLAWSNNSYEFPVNGPGAVSGSIFQQKIINGLEEKGIIVDLIQDYPYKEKIKMPKCDYSHSGFSDDTIIKFSGHNIIERVVKGTRIKAEVRKKLSKHQYDVVVGYLIHTPYLEGIKEAKLFGLSTILICPDLPDMMDLGLSKKYIKKLLKKIDGMIIRKLYYYVDGFVLFSEKMKEVLPVHYKPKTVIEGVASVEELDISGVPKKKYILYAGSLQYNFGIENIMKAMDYVKDSELELHIYGDGALKSYIEDYSITHTNIKYLGFIDRDELFTKEKEALALINARDPKLSYTRYSFPSKTFEYLYSGTPFITTNLACIPDDYKDHLVIIPDNAPITIAKYIDLVSSPLYKYNSNAARDFILQKKNKDVMAQRLIKLIEDVRDV